MSHARLSPSSAKRWMTCPASVSRNEGQPDKTSEAAEWGTCAHAILERALLHATSPLDVDINDLVIPAESSVDGVAFYVAGRYGTWDVQEMRETADVAYQHVLFQGDLYAESRSNPGQVIGREDCYGTADVTVINPDGIEVVDLKAGKGVLVEADDPQLTLYALGKLYEHFPGLVQRDDFLVTCTVVQPRANHSQGPVRSKTWTAAELDAWATETFLPAAVATDNPEAKAVPSEAGCRWCRVKGTCPELAAQGMAAAQAVFQPVPGTERQGLADKLTRDPGTLSPEEVQYILDHEKLITGWLKSVREHAKDTIMAGHEVPGYKMVVGRSSRSWDVEVEDFYKTFRNFTKQGGKKLTRDDLFETKPLSPAQAEKQIKPLVKESTWKRIEEHIIKSAGAPTLAPATDPRPTVLTNARDVFEPIEQQQPTEEQLPDFLS